LYTYYVLLNEEKDFFLSTQYNEDSPNFQLYHFQQRRCSLDLEVDVNAQGGHYSNALQAASLEDHEAVVRYWWISGGADVGFACE